MGTIYYWETIWITLGLERSLCWKEKCCVSSVTYKIPSFSTSLTFSAVVSFATFSTAASTIWIAWAPKDRYAQ